MSNVPPEEKYQALATDARKAMATVYASEAEKYAIEAAVSTRFGRVVAFTRQFFGLSPVSRKAIHRQTLRVFSESLKRSRQEELEDKVNYEKILQRAKNLDSLKVVPQQWPDKKTMKTQPVVALPDGDSDPTRTTAAIEIEKSFQEMVPVEKYEPFVEATRKPESPAPTPPPAPKVKDTKVNRTLLQGIIVYEVPLYDGSGYYERTPLEFSDSDAGTMVGQGVAFVYYNYGQASYEGTGYLVVVFHDGSVDTISLGHCSCNEPLDDLGGLKPGAYKDLQAFRDSLSLEAANRDYSTILAFINGEYPDPDIRTPGAQTVQKFPTLADIEPTPPSTVTFSVSFSDAKPIRKKRAKKTIKKSKAKKATKQSAKRRRK